MKNDEQLLLFKGELMEEQLRSYFNSAGYYVARGVKYRYEGFDITDIDLFLYGRASGMKRLRVNVDIKNKKSPQAFERILWANGLMKLLGFDSCVVATTDNRPAIQSFGQLHETIILDKNFLTKLASNPLAERLSEEELAKQLCEFKSYKSFPNKDWKYIYELSKSKLLTEQDYSGLNSMLVIQQFFVEKIMTDHRKQSVAVRMLYIITSHILITADYILREVAFLEQHQKEKKLSDGIKFGNLGDKGVDKIIDMVIQISGQRTAQTILEQLDSMPTDILRDFLAKNEVGKNLFSWAREFENVGFQRELKEPNLLDINLRGTLSVFLDFFKVDRKDFFNQVNGIQ